MRQEATFVAKNLDPGIARYGCRKYARLPEEPWRPKELPLD